MLSLSGTRGLSRESGGKTAALQKRGCADLGERGVSEGKWLSGRCWWG